MIRFLIRIFIMHLKDQTTVGVAARGSLTWDRFNSPACLPQTSTHLPRTSSNTSAMKRSASSVVRVSSSTGTPTARRGDRYHRRDKARASGVVVDRHRCALCRMEKLSVAALPASVALRRVTCGCVTAPAKHPKWSRNDPGNA